MIVISRFFLDEIKLGEKNSTFISDVITKLIFIIFLGDFLMEYEVNIEEDTTIIEKFPSISRGLYIHDFQVTIDYIIW